ncbi:MULTISPECIES: type II toxin-antitoxin system VapC family toxin [Gammaproteobacteria]|uniref:PIN domain-containing protein n=1 Tax=Gammaproteobacteria TaxID=1236 RepID=UPI001AD96891|nr:MULTISPECIES: type II toxin-antitoxin system VapC family toxin [Gammaproteobacteria]MBO9483134.1 type II toxin-antitoxin system VapC family toxin [Salinisphaera sp. G21_0]MBO9497081.1 type II toxin-antitoxin system VapC family toxin [Thalassotalea sp. G20_0]
MIAIDTNVLLRYLLDDDELQSPKAARLITGQHKVLITDVVLVETLWTLRGKKYNLDNPELIGVIQQLFAEPNLCFEDGQTVWRALNDFRLAKPVKAGSKRKTADFPDALIVNKANYCSKPSEPLDGVYTFDLAAQQIPGALKP